MHRAKNKLVLQNGVVWNQKLLLGVSEVRMHNYYGCLTYSQFMVLHCWHQPGLEIHSVVSALTCSHLWWLIHMHMQPACSHHNALRFLSCVYTSLPFVPPLSHPLPYFFPSFSLSPLLLLLPMYFPQGSTGTPGSDGQPGPPGRMGRPGKQVCSN